MRLEEKIIVWENAERDLEAQEDLLNSIIDWLKGDRTDDTIECVAPTILAGPVPSFTG